MSSAGYWRYNKASSGDGFNKTKGNLKMRINELAAKIEVLNGWEAMIKRPKQKPNFLKARYQNLPSPCNPPRAYGRFSSREDTWISKLGETHEINIGTGTLAWPSEEIAAILPYWVYRIAARAMPTTI